MLRREALQRVGALGGEREPNDTVAIGIGAAPHQSGGLGSIHELDRAVMAQQQVVGDVIDRWSLRATVAPDREQQLVLGRRQPSGLGLFLAPAQKTPVRSSSRYA